jgi:cellulose synthase/poly-beta-1,6-N-acetylglucosamine synthase-like glycosyltransferase
MLNANLIWVGIGLGLVADSVMRFVLLCLRVTSGRPAPRPGASAALYKAGGSLILIAAHNEAGTIGGTVAALRPQLSEWPGSQIWVVADRCADDTLREAREAGARASARREGRVGKGAAIAWWMEEHHAVWRGCETILILDADSRLQPGSLRELRGVMAERSVVAAQCFVAPNAGPDAAARPGRLAGWSEVLMQRMDDEARRRRGWSVPLRGAGMAFRGEALAALAPRLHTLAEDLELDVLVAAGGQRVVFVPEAVVTDPKPRQSAGASRQRARWLQGQLQVLAGYPRELLRALLRGGAGTWFLIFPLMMRPKIFFIGLRAAALALAPVAPALAGFALLGLGFDLIYYLAGAAFVDRPRQYLRDLLAVPHYAAMWGASLFITAVQRLAGRDRGVWLRAGRDKLHTENTR